MQTPNSKSEALEQIAAQTVREHSPHPMPELYKLILAALQTATKQPQGADWAVEAAKELASDLFSNCYGGHVSNYESEKAAFTQEIAAIIRKHAPLVANREDSERDSKRLDWLEKHAEDLFRDRAPDANGGWFCIRETSPQSKDKPLGEFVCKAGNTLRAAIDAAMRPEQPERGQGEGT